MSNPPLKACKKVEWAFRCPMKWEDLEDGCATDVRYCRECEKPVYLARNPTQLHDLAREGKCVAWRENWDIEKDLWRDSARGLDIAVGQAEYD